MNYLNEPWPWYIGGPIVAVIMLLLIYLGKSFGFSSNFRNICSLLGAGKYASFFAFDWKQQRWNLLFLVGSVIGGFIAAHYMSNPQIPAISSVTVTELQSLGIDSAGKAYVPVELFGSWTFRNIAIWIVGGLLIGFGTRYAGGCTSGHAISGLSDLQVASLLAVVGFFIGGLVMVHLFFPFIF